VAVPENVSITSGTIDALFIGFGGYDEIKGRLCYNSSRRLELVWFSGIKRETD
jgi:hypothetical protein